jgi:hypothetical protein
VQTRPGLCVHRGGKAPAMTPHSLPGAIPLRPSVRWCQTLANGLDIIAPEATNETCLQRTCPRLRDSAAHYRRHSPPRPPWIVSERVLCGGVRGADRHSEAVAGTGAPREGLLAFSSRQPATLGPPPPRLPCHALLQTMVCTILPPTRVGATKPTSGGARYAGFIGALHSGALPANVRG